MFETLYNKLKFIIYKKKKMAFGTKRRHSLDKKSVIK